MNTEKLDDVIKSTCAMIRDARLSRYTELLAYAREWLLKDDQRTGGMDVTILARKQGRRAWIPPRMLIDKVGIEVEGSFAPLLPNPNMIERDDDCGAADDPQTGHPDYPVYKATGNPIMDPRMYNATGWLNPGGWWGWYSPGLMFWPGQGGGKSVYGYYKIFKDKGFVLLDGAVAESEAVLFRGTMPLFSPNTITMISEFAIVPLRLYMKWKALQHQSTFEPGKRIDAQAAQREYVAEMTNLRAARNREPLCAMTAAWQSSYGQIGV